MGGQIRRSLSVALGAAVLSLAFLHPVATAAASLDPQPATPVWYYDVGSSLRNEIYSLWQRGATDATSLYVPPYSYGYSYHAFSETLAVTREEFFGMLGRAFHVTPSWDPSPFPDYTPQRTKGSLATWLTGREKPLKAIVVHTNAQSIVEFQLNLLGGTNKLLWSVDGRTYYGRYYFNSKSPLSIQLPANTYAVNIRNLTYPYWWLGDTTIYIDKIVYTDGTEEAIGAAINYWNQWDRNQRQIFPAIDAYYPWVRGAIALGWAQGYSDGLFRPDQTMTRLEAMVAMTRAMGYSDFARSLTKRQVDAILSRFWDSYTIPDALRPEVAVLVLTGVTRGYNDGSLRPYTTALRAHAAAFINRASRVLVEPNPYKWSPDGDGVNEEIQFRIEPGWPHRIAYREGNTECSWWRGYCYWVPPYNWQLTIYRLPDSGWTEYVGQVTGTQTLEDRNQNYILAQWNPAQRPPAGIYMAMAQIYAENPYQGYVQQFPSPLAPFEVVYHTIRASASPNRVRPGESVTVQALTTGEASRVTVTLPTADGGTQTFDMGDRGAAGKDSFYGDQERWEFVWAVPFGMPAGRYTLTLTAYYADGASPRTATVTVEVYEPFTPRCNPLENPVWVEPNKAVTVGCTDTTSGGQVVSGYASVAGRTYPLVPQFGRRWSAQVTVPAAPGAYSVTLMLQVRDSSSSTVIYSVPLTLVVVPPGQTPSQGMNFFGPLPGVPGRVRLIE